MNRISGVLRWAALPAIVGLFLTGAAFGDDNEADTFKKKIVELNKITGEDQVREAVKGLIKDKPNTLKLIKAADDMAKLDSKQLNYYTASILATSARVLKENEIALRLLQVCEKKAREIKSGKKIAESVFGQAAIHMANKNFEQTEELCKKALEQHIDQEFELDFFEVMVRAMTKQGKVDEALKMVGNVIDGNPAGWELLMLKAWIQQEAGKLEDTVKSYQQYIAKLEKSEEITPEVQERLIDRTKYILSNVYVEMNQIDKAAQNLKDLLKKKPDNSTYNNDLGYIWADHDMNLDEAEKLIRKAIDEDRKARKKIKDLTPEDDKDNAAYLDSLGWVLYKKKQYAEAKKYLQEAVKDEEGKHIEIIDHLADVQMALGEKAEAVKTWKTALDQEMNMKRDFKRRDEVIKKLKAAEGK